MANKLKKEPIVTTQTDDNGIIDIEFSAIRKKRFRLDGDDNKIIELNTSDLNIVNRFDESYPKLQALSDKVASLSSTETEEDGTVSDKALLKEFKAIDAEMRELIDYIFDSKVSDICADGGSMYDPLNGDLRYELIINRFMNLYETNLRAEANRIKSRVAKHTSKYTGK